MSPNVATVAVHRWSASNNVRQTLRAWPPIHGSPAKQPQLPVIGQAEGTPPSRLAVSPVSGVKWSSGRRVIRSVMDQASAEQAPESARS